MEQLFCASLVMYIQSGMLLGHSFWEKEEKEDFSMLWTIVGILIVLWLIGLIGHIAGGLIHILLVVAVIVIIYNLFFGRRRKIG